MTDEELGTALSYLRGKGHGLPGEIRFPYGHTPPTHLNIADTESSWNDFQWNPPNWHDNFDYTEPDPNASPKPTWEELQTALVNGQKFGQIIDLYSRAHYYKGQLDEIKSNLTDSSAIETQDGNEVYVGGGLNHMTGLLQIVENATKAGQRLPSVLVRDKEHNKKPLWSEDEIRDVLSKAGERENRVESAHNRIIKELHDYEVIRDDEDNTLDARLVAAQNAFDFLIEYQANLEKEIENHNDDAIPDDLPTAIKVLSSRLEAAANTNLKRILNAVTQQGMDLPVSCFDQETAVTEIGAIKQKYQLQIETATTIDEAKGYFDDAVKDLDNVTPLNTPEWSQYDANTHMEIGFNKDLEYEFVSDTPVVIAARHPQTPEGNNLIDGLVSVTITEGNRRYAESNVIITPERTHIRTEMRLIPPDKGLRPRMWRFTARNLCGPSKSICVSIRRETENE